MIMEIWKDVVGYEGLYQVSNMGRVKSLNYGRERILKASDNGSGYLYVALCKKGKYKNFLVHRLVAMVFISNPENKPCIDHIDTNKRNNKVENLRWVTHEENIIYSAKYNKEVKHNSMLGSKNPRAKYTDEDVKYIRELYNDGRTIMEIVKILYPNYDYNQRRKEWNLIRSIAKRKSFSNVE